MIGSWMPAADGTDAPRWPLSYQSNPGEDLLAEKWWHHTLYKGPQGQTPRVLYSKTKAESEEIAQEFIQEKILGFDMEWPWQPGESGGRDRLQDKIGLIQIASESKIALFHIGMHNGTTTQEIIAPTLKRIIESPDIIKLGVNIVNADFSRLRQHFGLDPKGAFELSHLYTLVRSSADKPEAITTRLVKLATQVEEVLGLPLSKNQNVRCSNWSAPLGRDQMRYAADDAYAGLMIYHCLNAQRAAMDPPRPLPVMADHYGIRLPTGRALCLQAPVTATEFLKRSTRRVETPQTTASQARTDVVDSSTPGGEIKVIAFSGDGISGAVKTTNLHHKRKAENNEEEKYDVLNKTNENDGGELAGADAALYHQLVQGRRELAAKADQPPYIIAHNAHLREMARLRPPTIKALQSIKGIGPRKAEQYGAAWIGIIAKFAETNDAETYHLSTSPRGVKRRVSVTTSEKQELISTPDLHTGLSFSVEQTSLSNPQGREEDDDSDSSAFGSPLKTPTTSRAKRNRSQNEHREASPTRVRQPLEPSTPEQRPHNRQIPTSFTFKTPRLPNSEAVVQQKSPADSQTFDSWALNHQATPQQQLSQSSPQESSAATQSRIFEKKLLAFSRQISLKLVSKPSTPLLTENTARQMATNPPRSNQELLKVPGVISLVRACAEAQVNLVDLIEKWAPHRDSS